MPCDWFGIELQRTRQEQLSLDLDCVSYERHVQMEPAPLLSSKSLECMYQHSRMKWINSDSIRFNILSCL
jgi:hypothetical protein